MKISENPLLTEFNRSMRKFFGVTRGGGMSLAVIIVVGCLYLLLLVIVLQFARDMPSNVLGFIQTFVFCLSIPAVMHGTIAGEREKRTWDLLAASPLSNREIIIGKYLAGTTTQIIAIGLMALPMVLVGMVSKETNFGRMLAEEAVSITFAISLSAICLFISNFTKRAYTSQLVAYAVLMLMLVVYPAFVAMTSNTDTPKWLWMGNPFVVIFSAGDPQWGVQLVSGTILIYVAVTAAILLYLPNRITCSEGDGPRRN